MSTIIQIKRTTTANLPSTLEQGELSYIYDTSSTDTDAGGNGGRIYIGDPTSNSNTPIKIGGKYYTDLMEHSHGTLTASAALLVDSNKKINELLVDNITIDGNAITSTNTNGDITVTPNGTGKSVITNIYTDASTSLQEYIEDISGGSVTAGEGIDVAYDDAAGTTTISGEDATVTNKGIASFATADFGVSSGAVSLSDTVVKTVTSDSGAMTPSSHGFSILGGEGMDVTHSGTTITVAGEDATVTNKGVASFATADFAVTSGAVTIKALGVANGQIAADAVNGDKIADNAIDSEHITNGSVDNGHLAGGIANAKLANDGITIGSTDTSLGDTITALAGMTAIAVDNITLDANTISTTNSNGDMILAPNGSGSVTVPSGYTSRAGFGSDSLVNKSYVDSVANGLDVKASVRVATTANLAATYNNGAGTLTASSNGAISVDGVTLVVNDRVLVKDQSTAAQNGFYKVTTVGSGSAAFVLTRTPDADAASELTAGAFTFTEEGTANADNGYVLSTNGAITLGTTGITFEQFSGAGQISAGNGLTKTGNTIDVVGTADKITVSSNAITIASSYVGQNTITTLGTIATGVWNGTDIGVAHGGTGLSAIAKGSVLVANSANTLSALDGGGSNDGFLSYTASSDTLSFATSVDGGTF